MSQKCQTMSPHQEATASSTSSLILGLKEFTKVVESPTRPWSSLSCFETTPSIQASSNLLDQAKLMCIVPRGAIRHQTQTLVQSYNNYTRKLPDSLLKHSNDLLTFLNTLAPVWYFQYLLIIYAGCFKKISLQFYEQGDNFY